MSDLLMASITSFQVKWFKKIYSKLKLMGQVLLLINLNITEMSLQLCYAMLIWWAVVK